MKIFGIIVVTIGCILLQGCDTQETKVVKYMKCRIAVDEIGDQQAKVNFRMNGVTSVFGDEIPKMSGYDSMRLQQEARDDLKMDVPNKRLSVENLIDEYEKSYCANIHQSPQKEKIKELKYILNL